MKSNDERIKTLEKFNIIGRKKRPVAAVVLLLLTAVFIMLGIVVPSFAIVVVIVPITSAIFFYLAAAVFLSLSIAMFKGVDTVRCPYCGAPVKMVPESEMNFRFHAKGPNKRDFYWVCTNYPECDAYIPADNTTKRPTGTLANAELRHMRMMIHYWQVILTMEGIMSRASFVRTMASILNIRNFNMVHVGEFTKMDAESVLEYFKMRYQNDKRVPLIGCQQIFKLLFTLCEAVRKAGFHAECAGIARCQHFCLVFAEV